MAQRCQNVGHPYLVVTFWLKGYIGGKEGEEVTVQNCPCPSQGGQPLADVCALAMESSAWEYLGKPSLHPLYCPGAGCALPVCRSVSKIRASSEHSGCVTTELRGSHTFLTHILSTVPHIYRQVIFQLGSHNPQVPLAHPQQRDCVVHRVLLCEMYTNSVRWCLSLCNRPYFNHFQALSMLRPEVQVNTCTDISGVFSTLEPFSSRFWAQREKLDTLS